MKIKSNHGNGVKVPFNGGILEFAPGEIKEIKDKTLYDKLRMAKGFEAIEEKVEPEKPKKKGGK